MIWKKGVRTPPGGLPRINRIFYWVEFHDIPPSEVIDGLRRYGLKLQSLDFLCPKHFHFFLNDSPIGFNIHFDSENHGSG